MNQEKINMWRRNAGLSKKDFSENFGIPEPVLQSWEDGSSTISPWIESLIIDKLMRITDETARKRAELILDMLVPESKSEVLFCSWAIIKASPDEEQLTLFDSLEEAVETYYSEDPTAWEICDVTYTICSQDEGGNYVGAFPTATCSYLYRDPIELN